MVRTHVVLPEGVVRDIDGLVGRRKRSQFLAEAAREKLARMELLRALEEAAGLFKDEDIPGWETADTTSEWIAESRARDEKRLDRVTGDG